MKKLIYRCLSQLTQDRHSQHSHPTSVKTHLWSDVEDVCHDNI
ncbi:hypothetical protein [Vibrio splendidus]